MTAFNKSLPKPPWLLREHGNKNTQRGQRYYRHLWNAQPDWADVQLIRRKYRLAKQMRTAGRDVEVDHIVPLQHPNVCGLHVHYNLEVVEKPFNAWKSNRRHPHHPQRELFDECDPFWTLEIQEISP